MFCYQRIIIATVNVSSRYVATVVVTSRIVAATMSAAADLNLFKGTSAAADIVAATIHEVTTTLAQYLEETVTVAMIIR